MSGMPLQSSGVPSLINKLCGNGALHRRMCLLQIFSGCCQSAKWNRLAQKHPGSSGGKTQSKTGQFGNAAQPTITWGEVRVNLQYWHWYGDKIYQLWYYLSLQPLPGCSSVS